MLSLEVYFIPRLSEGFGAYKSGSSFLVEAQPTIINMFRFILAFSSLLNNVKVK